MNEKQSINKIVKLNPNISSENAGDSIILDYCQKEFEQLFGDALYVDVPTRERLSLVSRRHIVTSDYAFVCGTNLLSSNMNKWKQWNITLGDAINILNANLKRRDYWNYKKYSNSKLILMGTGWWQYQDHPNIYTKALLKTLLSDEYIHSVRDSYTEKKLKSIGINNVVNTSCPTMWNLTEQFCEKIPTRKAPKVVTTLTNYNISTEKDEKLLEILCNQYSEVYVWLQAVEDWEYLKCLKFKDNVKIIPPGLAAYDRFLENNNTDYIGTRLHGGIRALNHMKRSLILAVDNRAIEISKDTNLPVIRRDNVENQLETWLSNPYETQISLPVQNIEAWKKQFLA